MRTVRLIVDEPGDGAWNMAVDDVLLAAAAERNEATLRFYAWATPTLSLGYFQSYDARQAHVPSRDCPIVRRASGGGAILHDRELTYSLALPSEFWPERRQTELYATVHDLLCRALAALGVRGANRFGQRGAGAFAPAGEPFLCFERRTEHDVVLGDAKIAGSAQRKRRSAVLQHGSVLLGRSPFAPSLAGIEEASGVKLSPAQLVDAWLPLLAQALNLQCRSETRFAASHAAAIRLAAEGFAAASWLRRR